MAHILLTGGADDGPGVVVVNQCLAGIRNMVIGKGVHHQLTVVAFLAQGLLY